ncbi:hypothetical protein LTR36_004156 [Oleoguttula mirabilis]|uniref:MYND-type domain-containing protein n=1 Tax=Oleoguttula mirabilis TaxID=1507867 RepID=A0AAV9JI73_9PEZI|nr:hypothetical protein LTR36_004156 [Oleoguttula mirabilis]
MSSAALPNLSCARCHTPAAHLDEGLKQCTGCRSIQYCSRDCQRNDWPRHKDQCRQAQTGDIAQPSTRTRTTTRLNWESFTQSRRSGGDKNRNPTPAGTIYYLQTSTPHLYDISVSGPYHSIDAVVAQAMINFGAQCRPGQTTVQDLVREGVFAGAEHVTSPINHDPNRTKTIRVLTEHNPSMAARLPGPAWCVIVAQVAMDQIDHAAGSSGDHVPVKDVRVHGTFGDEASANEAAQRVAQEFASRVRGGRVVDQRPAATGAFVGGVFGQASDGSQTMTMLHVRYDAGTVSH